MRPFLENVVREGHCYCAALRVLNMSSNINLTIPLEEWGAALSAGAPGLKVLDLSYGSKVQGDVAGLSGLTGLTELNLFLCNKVQGDVAGLSGLTRLMGLYLGGTQVHGDQAALRAAIPGLS